MCKADPYTNVVLLFSGLMALMSLLVAAGKSRRSAQTVLASVGHGRAEDDPTCVG